MDERTTKILFAAGAGIALAYFLNKPKDAAAAAPGTALPPTGGFGPNPSLGFDGGGGGGRGGDTGKTAEYGRENVKSYQQRLNWLRNYLMSNNLEYLKTGIPYIPLIPGKNDYRIASSYEGTWGPKTQAGADNLKKFILKAFDSPTRGTFLKAMAAAGNGSEPDYEKRLGKALIEFDTSKIDINDLAALAVALKRM